MFMLTQQDRQQLVKDLKEIFGTKDDLKAMEARQDQKYATKDDLKAMEARQDQKYATKDDLKAMEARQDQKYATKDELKKELKPIKDDLKTVKKDTSVIIRFFDREHIKLQKRVKKVEERLGITPDPS